MLKKLFRSRKGAALIEYGLLIAGVALISAVGVSVFGHKTSDLISTVAAVIPGAHTDDNNPIVSGKLIETTIAGGVSGNGIMLDFTGIAGNSNTDRLGFNIGGSNAAGNGVDGLVLEAH